MREAMRGFSDSRLRILVVDDDIDTALSLSFLFRTWGHDIQMAHDGPTAIAAARDFQPEAIVLDIGLPGMDGFEVARHLRSLRDFRRTLIAAASGFNQEEDRRLAREVGIDLYLAKPFDPWQLEEMFASRLSAAQAIPA
jgi:CheY-like chemotaxis protein